MPKQSELITEQPNITPEVLVKQEAIIHSPSDIVDTPATDEVITTQDYLSILSQIEPFNQLTPEELSTLTFTFKINRDTEVQFTPDLLYIEDSQLKADFTTGYGNHKRVGYSNHDTNIQWREVGKFYINNKPERIINL